jgi:acetyltransferase-like isoleucine patch superfamily enzyme
MKKYPLMTKMRNCIRLKIIAFKYFIYTKIYKMDIDKSARISAGVKLDKTNPGGIHIGRNTYITSGAVILSHDFCRAIYDADTYIGNDCFIGINTVVMPGIRIGNNVIVGSGSIVTKDIPSNCIAAGNPARIIRENVMTEKYGRMGSEVYSN